MSIPKTFTHGTRAQWTASGLILLEGQVGFVLEDNGSVTLVFGDGVHLFTALPSISSGGGTTTGTPASIGDLTALQTANKATLVAAINEVQTRAAQGAIIADGSVASTTTYSSAQVEARLGTKPSINDGVAGTTTTYSGTQIEAKLAALVASAPALLNTLKELADALGDDPNYAATTAASLGNRLRLDAAQGATETQKQQGRANLGVPGFLFYATKPADSDIAALNVPVNTIICVDSAS